MRRIFLTLALIANLLLGFAVWRGLSIEDAAAQTTAGQHQVGIHMLIGLGALTFATLVHAISFTYFMGTGRFLEETSKAYSLPESYFEHNQKLKYGILPGMTVVLLLMITTGALGAVADPATQATLESTVGVSDATIHMSGAVLMLVVNLIVTLQEFLAISGNARVIEQVLADVQRIRVERGLPVE